MARQHAVSRRQFLAGSAAAAAALATRRDALAQAPVPAQKFHAKPVPADIFIDHGINQETRLETLRGYLTPTSHFFIRHHATTCCACPRAPSSPSSSAPATDAGSSRS